MSMSPFEWYIIEKASQLKQDILTSNKFSEKEKQKFNKLKADNDLDEDELKEITDNNEVF
jgi:hypothetical protein